MNFQDGYKAGCSTISSAVGVQDGAHYIGSIEHETNILSDNLNKFKGYQTGNSQLAGDVVEYMLGGSFNVRAAVEKSPLRTHVDRSHDFGSPDITRNDGVKYGLKYYSTGEKSAAAQATSYFERYCQYKSHSGRNELTFENYLKEKHISPDAVMEHDPIYSGQVRIIPADQYEAAVGFLKRRIAKESMTRPELAQKYQDTLDNLATKIESKDGVISIELTKQEAEQLAKLAKEGDVDLSNYGISLEEMVDIKHILKEGLQAGTTAAIISFVLETAPELYKCIDKLIREGELDENDLKNVGLNALKGGAKGFVRGFVSASLVTACKAGKFGVALKQVNPSLIAGLTVVLMGTLTDSFAVASGDMPASVMADNLIKNIIVTSSGVGMGILMQTYMAFIPGAYLLGNFVGSAVANFVYTTTEDAILSYCIVSGSTFFGLVEQDYKLPEEVFEKIGLALAEVETSDVVRIDVERVDVDRTDVERLDVSRVSHEDVCILRRGVIAFRKVGYV